MEKSNKGMNKMKNFKLKKVIAGTLVAASVLMLNPIGASAEWKQDTTGWWYADGSSWVTGWKLIDQKWYYFNPDGYMERNTTIGGYQLGSDGAWIVNNAAGNGVKTRTGAVLSDADYCNKVVDISLRMAKWASGVGDEFTKVGNDSSYVTSDTFKQNIASKKAEMDAIYKETCALNPSDKYKELNDTLISAMSLYDQSITQLSEGVNENSIEKVKEALSLLDKANQQASKLKGLVEKTKTSK